MTRNDMPDKLEWSIRPRSGVDSAQWDSGITHDRCGSWRLVSVLYNLAMECDQGKMLTKH